MVITAKERRELRFRQVKELYLAGHDCGDISAILNMATSSVYLFLKQEGIIKKKKKMSPDKAEEIVINAFKEGSSASEIAFEFNLHPITVSSMLKKHRLISTSNFEVQTRNLLQRS